MHETPMARCRLYVDGVVVDEEWVRLDEDFGLSGAIAVRQRDMAEAAHARGSVWLAEVYDPSNPPGNQYLRFGTDEDALVNPTPLRDPDAFEDAMRAHPFFTASDER